MLVVGRKSDGFLFKGLFVDPLLMFLFFAGFTFGFDFVFFLFNLNLSVELSKYANSSVALALLRSPGFIFFILSWICVFFLTRLILFCDFSKIFIIRIIINLCN
jgi:hypothetical protein